MLKKSGGTKVAFSMTAAKVENNSESDDEAWSQHKPVNVVLKAVMGVKIK